METTASWRGKKRHVIPRILRFSISISLRFLFTGVHLKPIFFKADQHVNHFAYTLVASSRVVSSLHSSVDGKVLHRCVSKYYTNTSNGLDPPSVGHFKRNDPQLTTTYPRVHGVWHCFVVYKSVARKRSVIVNLS